MGNVCDAVILPSHWTYIVQKCARWCDRDTIHPITTHCTVKLILKLLFKLKKKKSHDVALNVIAENDNSKNVLLKIST